MSRLLPRYLPGLTLSLFLSRFMAEAAASWWWPAGATLGGLVGLGSGTMIWYVALRDRRLSEIWPTLLLWAYIIYPAYDVRLAAAIGGGALAAFLIERWPHPHEAVTDGFVFLTALLAYSLTLMPGLLPADAGEFQLAAARMGVAHPPGYPLYTLLGWLFTRLNPSNPMWATNFYSAVTMALAVMLAGRSARRFGGQTWAGLLAALILDSAASVWSTATQASIRPLTAFFSALCLERLAAFRATRRESALAGFMLAFSLGLTHHPSLAFPGIFYVLFLLLIDPALMRQPRRWPRLLGAFALGFLPWLYLPIRGAMGAPLAPEGLATWAGFWDHVLARGFAGDLFVFRGITELGDRFLVWLNILGLQWHPLIVVGGLLTALLVAWHDWRLFILLAGGFALHTFVTMTYRAPQTVEYLIPAHVNFAVLLAAGLSFVRAIPVKIGLQRAAGIASTTGMATLIVGLVALAAHNWPAFTYLAKTDPTRETAESLLNDAPPDAVVLANWHWATPLWTLQAVEGQRPDVEVIYVFPEGAEPLADTWVRRTAANIGERPVIVTDFYPVEYAATPYFFEPLRAGWQVRETPRRDPPPGMVEARRVFDNGLLLLGALQDDGARVGQTFHFRLVWSVEQPLDADFTASLHMVNPSQSISNSDVLMLTSRLKPGDVIVTRHEVGMPPFGLPTPADHYTLNIAAYTLGADGRVIPATMARRFLFTSLPDEISIDAADWPSPTAHPRHVVFANGARLYGQDWEGDTLYLHARMPDGSSRTLAASADTAQALIGEQIAGWTPRLGPWAIPHGQGARLRGRENGERYVPLGGDVVLSRVRATPSRSLSPGTEVTIDVDLLAARPLVEDKVVKIDLIGQHYDWIVRSDHIPATGAIPTLKWLGGWHIIDRHRFTIPEDASTSRAHAELLLYDHFTGEIVPLMDIALARNGIVVPLYEWTP